jgi:Spy/CpxP family protein refolding chaperone
MKKIILSALIVSMAIGVNAQDIPERKTGKPGMHHKMDRKKGDRMDMQKLNLTEDQKAKFKAQRESFRSQMEALKKNEKITVGEQRAQMEAIRKENKTKMQSFLTADQKA